MPSLYVFSQGPRIDFQIEGAKNGLYFVSPGGASMVDAGRENVVFWFSRTQEHAFLDAFSKNFTFLPEIFFVQQKSEGAMAHPPRPRLGELCFISSWRLLDNFETNSIEHHGENEDCNLISHICIWLEGIWNFLHVTYRPRTTIGSPRSCPRGESQQLH